jgi:hypothetical protein
MDMIDFLNRLAEALDAVSNIFTIVEVVARVCDGRDKRVVERHDREDDSPE